MGTMSDLITYIEEFRLEILLSKIIRKFFYKSNSSLAWKINDYNERLIAAYLKKQFKNAHVDVDDYLQDNNGYVPEKPIWIMWWQGEENAPEIVKCCMNSVRKNCNGHKVIIISELNVSQYLKIPDYILEKSRRGSISRTHLSDMIRLHLLYLYGGLWIDATVFVSRSIPEYMFDFKFYTCKLGMKTKDPSHGRWTTFLMFGESRNKLFKKVLECHYIYWMKHDIIIDYIMFDYVIDYVINKDKDCYAQIERVPVNNRNVFELAKILNNPSLNWNYDQFDQDTIFYKLSYKHNLVKEINGQKTIYGKLLEEIN